MGPSRVKRTINNAIRLARRLNKHRGAWNLIGSQIIIRFRSSTERFKLRDLLKNQSSSLEKFLCFLQLKSYGFDVNHLGNLLVVTEPHGIKWVLRKNVIYDLLCGPLLGKAFEVYEYKEWFLKYIGQVDLFLDIGAYIGGYAIRACRAGVKSGIAVEPDPENYSLLLKNVELNEYRDKIRLLNIAAGDCEALLPLFSESDENLGTVNLLGKGKFRGISKVYPLDKILSVSGRTMVKIDVEGFEVQVLRGMEQLLNNVEVVFIEALPQNIEYIKNFLESRGFKFIDKCWYSEHINCLFVRLARGIEVL